MSGLRVVMLVVMVALSACASKDGGQSAAPGRQPGKIVDVEIIVGSKDELEKRCAGNVPPTAVFVLSQKEVFHCIGNKLHHHDEHGKTPGMDDAIVRVAANERIRWFSTTALFTVTSVTKQLASIGGPQDKTAPDTPFGKSIGPGKPASEVVTTPVPDLDGKIEQRYKVAFNIQGIGPVDPDVVCSF